MRRALLLLLVLTGCSDPTAGQIAMAELEQQMRSQADLVQQGEALELIFDGCSDDCDDHRAGYLWALDDPNAVDEASCENASAGFAAGCRMGIRAAPFQ